MDGLVFDLRWTDEIDEKYISDFLFVQNAVFNCGTRDGFRKQFEENIYGRSLIVIVYLNGNPIAARAVWRNDINGTKSYQLGSNCVLPKYRGKGIFTEMTSRAVNVIKEISSDSIIYSFPNQFSYPGYIKMGWRTSISYKLRMYTSYKKYLKEHPIMIDNDYVKWWLIDRPLKYTYISGHYFLLQKDRRTLCYRILGEVEKDVAKNFPFCVLGIFFYKSQTITWYNKRLGYSHVIINDNLICYIPVWKIDAV